MNGVNGQMTYPATTAAMHVLGYGDTFLTHSTVPYFHKAFTALWTDVETPEYITHDFIEEGGKVWSCVDDYLNRPRTMEEFPPVMMAMFFEKKHHLSPDALHQDPHSSLEHPQPHKCFIERPMPYLPQFISVPPSEPDEQASDETKLK